MAQRGLDLEKLQLTLASSNRELWEQEAAPSVDVMIRALGALSPVTIEYILRAGRTQFPDPVMSPPTPDQRERIAAVLALTKRYPAAFENSRAFKEWLQIASGLPVSADRSWYPFGLTESLIAVAHPQVEQSDLASMGSVNVPLEGYFVYDLENLVQQLWKQRQTRNPDVFIGYGEVVSISDLLNLVYERGFLLSYRLRGWISRNMIFLPEDPEQGVQQRYAEALRTIRGN